MSDSDIGAKPPQSGLVDMGDISFYNDPSDPIPQFTLSDLNNYPQSFSEIVLNVTWAQLQPIPNEPGPQGAIALLDTQIITSAIDQVNAFNTANNTDVGIKLRVWGGYTAPDWAKNIDGQAITVSGPGTIDPNKDQTETIGRFWSADYINAWTTFQAELAAAFDDNPVIHGISNTAGAAATDEPFVPLHPNQVSQLEAAGYHDAAEIRTLRNAVADYAQWSTTPLDYTTNLFHLEDSGKVVSDANLTLAVLQEAESAGRIVQAGNHALNNPLPTSDAFVYAQLRADAQLDPATTPASYQTASPVTLGSGSYANWPNAITKGVISDGGDIELWDGPGNTGFTGLPTNTVAQFAAIPSNGVAPTTNPPDDGVALAFIAPGSVSGAPGVVALTGVSAVLLASVTGPTSYTVKITSTNGDLLTVRDAILVPQDFPVPVTILGANGMPLTPGPNNEVSSTSLTFSASLGLVNTILASLTDNVPSGTDILQFTATDNNGDSATRSVGASVATASTIGTTGPETASPLLAANPVTYTWTGQGTNTLFSNAADWSPAGGPPGIIDTAVFSGSALPTSVSGTGNPGTLIVDDIVSPAGASNITVGQNNTGDVEVADQAGTAGTLVLGGVNAALTIKGNLDLGGTDASAGGNGTLLAALAPSNYSTTSLAIGGNLQVWGTGAARFSGALSASTITVANGGLISGDGTLAAAPNSTIVNDGTIEAVADQTMGSQQLTVASPIGGTGALEIDPGATLILTGGVGANQTVAFATPSIEQLSNDPYSPTTLELGRPFGFQGNITGFSFAGSLVLDGFAATSAGYTSNTLTVSGGSSVLSYSVTGDLTELTPVVSVTGSGGSAVSTVTFVAKGAGQRPSVTAPATLHAAPGFAVLVPDIVLATPLPQNPINNNTVLVTVTVHSGGLAAQTDNGNTTITQLDPRTLELAGTLGAVESSLQTLTYDGDAIANDTISVTVSDYAGQSTTPAEIAVTNGTSATQYDWVTSSGGSFGAADQWTVSSGATTTAPGGADFAVFGGGTYTVTGDGTVGEMAVSGTMTMTGAVTVQDTLGQGLTVDAGGALTLAGGALLTVEDTAVVGSASDGSLTLMGGALALTGSGNDLVVGENAGASGTVLDLEQIEANGNVVVGASGSGTLHVMGQAATLSDAGADVGQSSGGEGIVDVDGGAWMTSGTLTVGDLGTGTVRIGGVANGVAGQATALAATIGAQAGGVGTVSLTGGDLLIANATANSSMLTVGSGGTGTLDLAGGSNVTVGAALASTGNNSNNVSNNGLLVVGGTPGGSGVVNVGGASALLVDGDADVGGSTGAGTVTIGQSATDTGLLAMTGTLTIGASGTVTLGGAGATVRAAAVTIDANGGTLTGAGVVSGDGGGNGTVTLTSITNDGTITADGALLLYGSITGTGTLAVANNAKLTLQAAVGAGQILRFDGPNGVAEFNDVGAFNSNDSITGFSGNDVLDLASATATGATWNDNILTITTTDAPITLTVEGNYAADAFFVHPDGAGGTDIDLVPCYLAGTLILTDQGERPVETLAIGDLVVTATGAARRIRWIGRRSYGGRFAKRKHLQPICIKAGALDDGVPRRDLWISPHHAMFLEGVLIEAQDLVNGATIVQADDVERIDYFHVELDTHDILIAEGALSESFIDDDSRGIFQNAYEYKTRYPDAPITPAAYCAPRAAFGPELESARRRIFSRAGIPYVSRVPTQRPHALVIDSFVPHTGHSGGTNAILDHMRALRAAGFEVSFLATEDVCGRSAALNATGVRMLQQPGMTARSILRKHAGEFDLVYLHRVDNATRYGRLARQCFGAQIVYSVADLHHVRLQGQQRLERNPVRAQELGDACAVVAMQEIAAAIAADQVITHSVAEAEQLRQIPQLAQAEKVHVIPWSIPARPVSTPFAQRAGVAFIGGFKHAPNVDAVRWFVDEVLPVVWQIAPEIECLLVGSDLTDELRRDLGGPGVTILGHVENLAEFFERVRLTVAPLRFGAGLKDKVLRSLAAGLPCVGTIEAFRGMADLPAALTDICIANSPHELAAAIVRLHRDHAENARCREAGLEFVRANYSSSRIDALVRALVRPALERHWNASNAMRGASTILSFADGVSNRIEGANVRRAMSSRRLVFGRT